MVEVVALLDSTLCGVTSDGPRFDSFIVWK